MDRDDGYLYHADGEPYWDGDPVDLQGLLRADGSAATFADFTKRYWSFPPPEWAEQFEEYATWEPSPMRWLDPEQFLAERLITTGGEGPSLALSETKARLRDPVGPEHRSILDEVEILAYGLPTLNGYADLDSSGRRCIFVHAGVVVILSHLSTFLVQALSPRVDLAVIPAALVELASYVGSGGRQGNLRGVYEPALPETMEAAHAGLVQLLSIPLRQTLLNWIVGHECAHHLLGHLESTRRDLARCGWKPDAEHLELRRRHEFEADSYAWSICIRLGNDSGLLVMLFQFLQLADRVLNVSYDDMSTHPSTSARLDALLRYDDGQKESPGMRRWRALLRDALEGHELANRAKPEVVHLQCPPALLSQP